MRLDGGEDLLMMGSALPNEATTTIRHVFPSFVIERSDYDVV